MKKFLIAALAGICAAGLAAGAAAQTPAASSNATAKPKIAKKHVVRKKKSTAAAAKQEAIAEGAVRWSCEDGAALYIKGDMKRDQILTVYWNKHNYQLPRQSTTTGADRFHDLASGLDLVVIPTKAMLLDDKNDERLADECKTPAMAESGTPAPTQANALLKGKQ